MRSYICWTYNNFQQNQINVSNTIINTNNGIPPNWIKKPDFEYPLRRNTTDSARHSIVIDGILYVIWLISSTLLSTMPNSMQTKDINGTTKIPTKKLKMVPTLSRHEYRCTLSLRINTKQSTKYTAIIATKIGTLSAWYRIPEKKKLFSIGYT